MKRYYFECENGRRWTEVDTLGIETKDGDTCNFSGCLKDHKVKLIKTTIDTGVLSYQEENAQNWEEAQKQKETQTRTFDSVMREINKIC